jgi:GNAT superfamily N-acetyltransferase
VTRDEFIATQFPGLAAWIHSMAAAADGSWVHELDGVSAQVSPSVADASLFNSVAYRDAAALRAALLELQRVYDDAGVRAWTVWAHASDEDAAKLLRQAGHRLDASPEGMGCALDDLIAPQALDELDYVQDPTVEDLQLVLARGYGFPLAIARRAIRLVPSGPDTLVGIARCEGRPASTVQVTVCGEDAGVYGVATVPEARGRGLARRLQYALLQRARERGARTSSLQATDMGRPVYAALGYRAFGAMNMWERRKLVTIDLSRASTG